MGGIEVGASGHESDCYKSTDASNGFNKPIKSTGLMRRLERRSAGWLTSI